MVTERALRKWHAECRKFIEEEWKGRGCPGLLEDPRRIYNIDETGIFHDARTGRVHKVVAERGSTSVMELSVGTSKMTTVTAAISADGWMSNPVILKASRQAAGVQGLRMADWPEAYYDSTESGWQTSDSFLRCLNALVMEIKEREDVEFPIALFVDGHKSHMSEECALWARQNDVILYGLNANSTFLQQPFDVGIFSPLKSAWFKRTRAFFQEHHHAMMITSQEIPGILKKVWLDINKEESIRNAFRKCGLYPWDAEAIDYGQLPAHARMEPLICSEGDSALETAAEEEPTTVTKRTSTGHSKEGSWEVRLQGDKDGRISFRVPWECRDAAWYEGIMSLGNTITTVNVQVRSKI